MIVTKRRLEHNWRPPPTSTPNLVTQRSLISVNLLFRGLDSCAFKGIEGMTLLATVILGPRPFTSLYFSFAHILHSQIRRIV